MIIFQRDIVIAFFAGVLIVVAVVSCGSVVEKPQQRYLSETADSALEMDTGVSWVEIPDQGSDHVEPGAEHPPYNSTPATSGWHYGHPFGPVAWGLHDEMLPDEVLVHNLEHGGVGIHYDCPTGCPEIVSKLEDVAIRAQRVVLSPHSGLDSTIVLTAWNFIDRFDVFDYARIKNFIDSHLDSGRSPESGVR